MEPKQEGSSVICNSASCEQVLKGTKYPIKITNFKCIKHSEHFLKFLMVQNSYFQAADWKEFFFSKPLLIKAVTE